MSGARFAGTGLRAYAKGRSEVAPNGRPGSGVSPPGALWGSVRANPVPPGANTLSGRVRSALYTGVSTQYQVDLPDGASVTVYEQNFERARASTQWQVAEELVLSWSPDDTFAVDPPADSDASDAEMLGAVTVGVPATSMTGFASVLDAGERADVVAFTRTLSLANDRDLLFGNAGDAHL